MLCNSITDNNGVMAADKTIRMNPDKSLLKYVVGDEIALSEADLRRLAKGFFAEIESRYA